MRTDLPTRIDSGVQLVGKNDVCRKASTTRTICDEHIGPGAKPVSDNAIRVRRLSKCRACWRTDGAR